MVSPAFSSSLNVFQSAHSGTRRELAIRTRGAQGCVLKTATGFPDWTSNVSSSSSPCRVLTMAQKLSQFLAALPVPPSPGRAPRPRAGAPRPRRGGGRGGGRGGWGGGGRGGVVRAGEDGGIYC